MHKPRLNVNKLNSCFRLLLNSVLNKWVHSNSHSVGRLNSSTFNNGFLEKNIYSRLLADINETINEQDIPKPRKTELSLCL